MGILGRVNLLGKPPKPLFDFETTLDDPARLVELAERLNAAMVESMRRAGLPEQTVQEFLVLRDEFRRGDVTALEAVERIRLMDFGDDDELEGRS